MNRRVLMCGLALFSLGSTSAHAFFEEGLDDPFRLGYMKCRTEGDLVAAQTTGCNPWPDNDSSYTFRKPRDIKKSSVHYNATGALAVAAGFNRCAAFIIALADEATDVALEYDQLMWAPFPEGVSEKDPACAKLLVEEGLVIAKSVTGRSGAYVEPDFTHRSFGGSNPNEVNRESASFHWNHSDSEHEVEHICTPIADPAPLNPTPELTFKDMVTLYELKAWAMSDPSPDRWFNPLNSCDYLQPDGSLNLGPLVAYNPYDPGSRDPKPGSLSAFGTFLHSEQDNYSHGECIGINHGFGPGGTDDPCGFVSGHYAGEFGGVDKDKDGKVEPYNGVIIDTSVAALPHRIGLHSETTVDALLRTYDLMVEYLERRPEFARAGFKDCTGSVPAFAREFATIPNYVPEKGEPSGAKRRSDLADSLFDSDSCSFKASAW